MTDPIEQVDNLVKMFERAGRPDVTVQLQDAKALVAEVRRLRALLTECARVLPCVIEISESVEPPDLADIVEAKEAFREAAGFLLPTLTAGVLKTHFEESLRKLGAKP